MTIPRTLDVALAHKRLGYLERCVELAPARTYGDARKAVEAVGEAVESVRSIIKAAGFEADGSDKCRALESVIYWFLRESSPEAYGLATGEGFGEHVDGPAGARVLANATRDRDARERIVRQQRIERQLGLEPGALDQAARP